MKDVEKKSGDRENNIIFINDYLKTEKTQENKILELPRVKLVKAPKKPRYKTIVGSVAFFMTALHLLAYAKVPNYSTLTGLHLNLLLTGLGTAALLSLFSFYSARVGTLK